MATSALMQSVSSATELAWLVLIPGVSRHLVAAIIVSTKAAFEVATFVVTTTLGDKNPAQRNSPVFDAVDFMVTVFIDVVVATDVFAYLCAGSHVLRPALCGGDSNGAYKPLSVIVSFITALLVKTTVATGQAGHETCDDAYAGRPGGPMAQPLTFINAAVLAVIISVLAVRIALYVSGRTDEGEGMPRDSKKAEGADSTSQNDTVVPIGATPNARMRRGWTTRIRA